MIVWAQFCWIVDDNPFAWRELMINLWKAKDSRASPVYSSVEKSLFFICEEANIFVDVLVK